MRTFYNTNHDLMKMQSDYKKGKLLKDHDKDLYDALTMGKIVGLEKKEEYVKPPTRNRGRIDITMSDIEELLGLQKGSVRYLQSDSEQQKVSIGHSDTNKGAKPVEEGEFIPAKKWGEQSFDENGMPRPVINPKPFRKTYKMDNAEIKAELCGLEIGIIENVDYQISREMAPIYTMGSRDPRSFARNKRAIAGCISFKEVDRDNLRLAMGRYRETLDPNKLDKTDMGIMPPIKVVLTAKNEYGSECKMELNEVELMNYGYGFPIGEFRASEYTFIAKTIVPWVAVENVNVGCDAIKATTTGNDPWEFECKPLLVNDPADKNEIHKVKLKERYVAGVYDEKALTKEDNHEGQTYNPYTDTWSWI